ncbi:uncharacterized protein C8Q71DRAFT_325252 [Rhodofomes roseus]|uniref:Uncharacterized protein n=1 Tax=Rhodofomes roseus TaxID=34475 RepID=A0ABQ8K267_9APHY|nr:uncharacterized protein C8Q71DRAFT_325252 [Rhodofomes roseus]KAH9830856.1 hypothetical protein C8Q71DRAFT_325252 [Rhodofomes roseus]
MDTSPNLPIPRLRLTRHSPPGRADTLNTPTAGPSRTSPEALRARIYDEDDAEATPRMPAARIADSPQATIAPGLPLDTPAARLRMALARVPNNTSPPRASTSRLPEPQTPSEPDSDLDPPYSITATRSIARESLRELFSSALQPVGNTPQKSNGRVRRNSVGPASEVDPSPRIERVEREREGNKGKRKSMSDEEVEHLSNVSRRSEESSQSSHSRAARYNALNAVLSDTHSSTMPPTPPPERMVTDMTMPPSDTSQDTATILREMNRPEFEATPPHATSTPMRTLQMSSQLSGQSNLLDGDSEMRHALGGFDSYEGDSLANGHAPPFPPSRSRFTSPPPTRPTSWSSHMRAGSSSPNPPSANTGPVSPGRPLSWSAHQKSDPVSPGRPLSWSSHSKSHSVHNLQMPLSRRGSEELENSTSSRGSLTSSSSQSIGDYKERQDDLGRDRLRDRERLWNHPQPKSPARTQHLANGRNSPYHAHTLSRKGSAASLTSLQSTDDGRSSRASSSSVMSQAERLSSSFFMSLVWLTQYVVERERVKELEQERQKEREHGWNKAKHAQSKTLERSSSSLNLRPHERTRTLSSVVSAHTPPRPDSAQSFLSPHTHTPGQPRHSLSRQSSSNSLRGSASEHSRAASPAGSMSGMELEPEEKEFVHVRERNWNSPRPKWDIHTHRSPSPVPPATSASGSKVVSPRERRDSSMSTSHASVRQRTESLRSSPAPTATGHARTRTLSSMSYDTKGKTLMKPKSPAPSLGMPSKSPGFSSRSPSPVRATHDESEHSDSQPPTPGFRSRFGWAFPVNRTQLPPLELDNEIDSPEKRRPATSISSSRLSLKSPGTSHIPRPSSALGDAAEAAKKRGHRRSITELSQSNGPIPPVSHTDERDDDEISIEIDHGSDSDPDPEDEDEESRFPSFHSESQMDPVFASDEESPPATSTPTARPAPLPRSPPSPSPSYSPDPIHATSSRQSDTTAHDGDPHSSKVEKPESPPPTPADRTPAPVFTLQTPPRRSPGNGSSSASSSKLEFKTPSPPRGMPDLPDLPSFATEDGDGEGENDNTPVMTSAPGNLTMMKTPRPPGAWAATPDVRHDGSASNRFAGKNVGEDSSASSVLVNTPDGQAKVDIVATPGGGSDASGAIMPNTTATWPRTPAPPGAWLQTPGGPASVRRRSILKVRFDVESETTVSDIGDSSAETKRPALPAEWNPNAGGNSSTDAALAMPPVTVKSEGEDRMPSKVETPATPPPRPESAGGRPFRSPGSVTMKIVDAFGRETTVEEEKPCSAQEPHQEAPTRSKTPERKTQQSAPPTPRSRSAVKIVDAMGREVEEPVPEASGSRVAHRELYVEPADVSLRAMSVMEDEGSSIFSVDMPTPTNHTEALALVREQVKTMKKEARQADKDRSCLERALDDGRARSLEDASNKARNLRRSISQTLQRVEGAGTSADSSRTSKYAALKENMRRSTSRFLPSAMSETTVKSAWSRGAWLFWAFVLIQLGFCLVMYRLANMRARRLFLTTYYDPFYSDLYHFARAPSASNPSAIPPYPSWYELPAMLARGGWQSALHEVWSGTMCALSLAACEQRGAPEVWTNAAYGQSHWPPA